MWNNLTTSSSSPTTGTPFWVIFPSFTFYNGDEMYIESLGAIWPPITPYLNDVIAAGCLVWVGWPLLETSLCYCKHFDWPYKKPHTSHVIRYFQCPCVLHGSVMIQYYGFVERVVVAKDRWKNRSTTKQESERLTKVGVGGQNLVFEGRECKKTPFQEAMSTTHLPNVGFSSLAPFPLLNYYCFLC